MKILIHKRILSAALLLLVSYIFWQWRYEKVSQNLVAEGACNHAQHWQGMTTAPTVSFSEDGLVLRKKQGGPSSSVFIPLGDLGDARHIAVKCDVAWEDCHRDLVALWAMPRIVIIGTDQAGHFLGSSDHGAVIARGTRKWHREHCIIELPPALKNARISIDAYGIQGTLRVKNLQVELVHQRAWAEKTGILLIACWVIWLAWNLHPFLRGQWRVVRSLLLGSALLAAFTVFIFPQPRSLERSIGLQFWLGPRPIAPPPPVTADVAKEPGIYVTRITKSSSAQPSMPKVIRMRTIPPPAAEPLPVSPPLPIPTIEPVATPTPMVIDPPSRWEVWRAGARDWLLAVDRKWNFRSYNLTHFTSFFVVSLCVIVISRRARLLWIVVVMAICAEIIPNLIHSVGDSGDYYDVMANTLGVFSALILYRSLSYMIFQRRKKNAALGSSI